MPSISQIVVTKFVRSLSQVIVLMSHSIVLASQLFKYLNKYFKLIIYQMVHLVGHVTFYTRDTAHQFYPHMSECVQVCQARCRCTPAAGTPSSWTGIKDSPPPFLRFSPSGPSNPVGARAPWRAGQTRPPGRPRLRWSGVNRGCWVCKRCGHHTITSARLSFFPSSMGSWRE